jgi:hypothetical protein
MGRLAKLFGHLDARPHSKGHEFKRLVKWLLGDDPLYVAQLDTAWLERVPC